MATGDVRIYATTSVVHGSTTVNAATHAAMNLSAVKALDPGPAGSPGPADEVTTDKNVAVTIFAMDPSELQSLVDAAAANLVITYVGAAGAAATITVNNVKFCDPPTPINVPRKDAGGQVPVCSINGRAQWGASDTWALMVAYG